MELGQRHLAGQLTAIKKVDQLGKQLGVTHHTGILLTTGTKVRKEGFAVTEGLPTDPCSLPGRYVQLCHPVIDTAGGEGGSESSVGRF